MHYVPRGSLVSVSTIINSTPFILLSIDSVDGPGSVPGDAAGDRAVSSALLCASRRLHYHRRGYLRPARADGNS